MATRLGWLGIAAASVAVGTLYVVVHESRRKRKKAEKVARDAPITKDLLLAILNKSADASKVVIEKVGQQTPGCPRAFRQRTTLDTL